MTVGNVWLRHKKFAKSIVFCKKWYLAEHSEISRRHQTGYLEIKSPALEWSLLHLTLKSLYSFIFVLPKFGNFFQQILAIYSAAKYKGILMFTLIFEL